MKSLSLLLLLVPMISSLGEPEAANIQDADVGEMTTFALDMLNKKEGLFASPQKLSDIKIVSASRQLVAGELYHIVFNVGSGKSKRVCEVEVYDVPYEGHRELKSYKCDPAPTAMFGQEKPVSMDDMEQKAVQLALRDYNSRSNSAFRAAVKSVVKITKQTVTGTLYRFTLRLVDTQCPNTQENLGKGLDECHANQNGRTTECSFEVLIQSWKNDPYSVTMEKCKEVSALDKVKAELAEKLKSAILTPDQTLPLFGLSQDRKEELTNEIDSVINDPKLKSELAPMAAHIGRGLLDAFNSLKSHKSILGGDDHDRKPHGGMNLIGGDDHDYQTHGKSHPRSSGRVCDPYDFKQFQTKYSKLYASPVEEEERFHVFCDNLKLIDEYNKNEQGSATYGPTKFADLTPKEFREKYLSKRRWSDIPDYGKSQMQNAKIPSETPPKEFDWRKQGAVTPVKNQGSCGSCWAFSTTGNIEGQWKINQGSLLSLSEQELVDCDKLDDGCEGGLPSNAYMSIMKLGGLETEKDYKYKGEDEKCLFNKTDVEVTINGAVNISSNEDEMAAWLYKNGPISIGINAIAMQFYFGGISHPWKILCDPSELDHGVLIVGYGLGGSDGTEPYWIIKNSWGTDWGEDGYYLVYRGGGVCGLNTMCTSAVVDKSEQ